MIIKSGKELEQLSDELRDQGFGYINYYEMHKRKIENIINNANTLNLDKFDRDKLSNKIYRMKLYSEMEEEAKKFFSQFDVNTKVKEYVKQFHLQNSDSVKIPSYHYPSEKEIRDFVEFKEKYHLDVEYNNDLHNIDVYNLDKKIWKFSIYNLYESTLKEFYKLVYKKDSLEFNLKKIGEWQNLGEIEIKLFKNDKMDVKGNLKPLQTLYFEEEKNTYQISVIIYQGKQQVFQRDFKD